MPLDENFASKSEKKKKKKERLNHISTNKFFLDELISYLVFK